MSQFKVIHRRNNFPAFPVSNNPDSFFKKNPLRIDVRSLELAMDNFFGTKLSEIDLGEGEEFLAACNNLLRRYSNIGSIGNAKGVSSEFFGEITKPTASLYDDIEDMAMSISEMYQISYCHYILGKYNAMRGSFPNGCCGISARNLLIAFWEAGVASAVKACTSTYDHAYVLIPFVLRMGAQKGIILVDPTSDQLVNDPKKKTRNLIRIITQDSWSYITDWRGGADLSADEVEVSACYGSEDVEYAGYLREALKNPAISV
ncbi:hypothetical protein ACFL08_01040 [Patescibacteria group bacterium]